MMNKDQIIEAAHRLNEAEQTRKQIRQLSLDFPKITMDDAYAIQRAWVASKIADGRKVIGHKIGLTSRAMQMASQITEPDYGTLLDDMQFGDGTDIPMSRFILPMVEVELAFILGKRLEGDRVTIFEVLSATDYVVPAMEIIDARIHRLDPDTKRPRRVFDTISDNAANAGIVMGGRPVRPMDVDLRWVAAILQKNGAIEDSGVAAAVLNHPANGIAWLAKKFAPHGVALEAGQIVLSGSFTRPMPVGAGDTVHADYGALGVIACRFV
ncbi:MAG: 2-oxo-hept-4-ene-1,7-dioate hydratase [Betaproteobacteria bacterium]